MRLRFDFSAPKNFTAPSEVIVASSALDVPRALAALDRARRAGRWVAGLCAYELGYALEPRLAPLMPGGQDLPLLIFGVFDGPSAPEPLEPGGALGPLHAQWSKERYARAFETLHEHIAAGDIYQANLTFPLKTELEGSAFGLYSALLAKHPVKHSALAEMPGLPALVSLSPELFFRTDGAGRIETRPMKGTQPRATNPAEDAARAAFLQADPKNRAENLMIVDLLRNDISRICEVGSVRVPELFAVEQYKTVHQMVSTVEGRMLPGTELSDILRALFPCGSITGAPKVRAMEIIADLEEGPRGAYCGAIGWMAPDGASEFNVAIRTLTVRGQDVTLNVGGGVVYDSDAASEYEEALWKSRFARMSPASA